MIFKVTFEDGSSETVNAISFVQAKINAVGHFRDRLVVKIEAAGLSDLALRPVAGGQPSPLTALVGSGG